MKIKTKKTSVWQGEISLKKDRIINNKFNFSRLDKFYVTNLNNFIEKLVKEKKTNFNRLNEELRLGKDYLRKKVRERRAIPIYIFKKVLKALNTDYDEEKLVNLFIENNAQFQYRDGGGCAKPLRLPFYPKEVPEIIEPLRPHRNNNVYLSTKNNKIIEKITNFFSIKEHKRKDGLYELNSVTLNRFLRYFFDYNKKALLKFPLSNINLKCVDLTRGIALPLLLTDGNVYKKGNSYYFDFFGVSKNKELHEVFADSLYLILNKHPTQYFHLKKNQDLRKTSFIVNKKIAEKILKICNTAKTCPAKNQEKEDYIKEVQPSIDFLFKCNKETKIMALRLWFCAEGSISFNRAKSRNMIRPHLNLSCANPLLINQLKSLLNEFGIKMIIRKKESNWSGLDGLYATRIDSILNFLKIGGFLPETYIQNSKFHKGIKKQGLLLAIFEYISKEKEGSYTRDVSIGSVHQEINNIIKNRQLKSPEYYISKLSIN